MKKTKRPLDDIALSTAEWHTHQAEAAKYLKEDRQELFDTITAIKREGMRARKTVVIAKSDVSNFVAAEERVDLYNPGWLRDKASETDNDYHFILIEDPAFMQHEIRVPASEDFADAFPNGWTVTKTVRSGTPMIDLDRMKKDDPDLYIEVTYVEYYDVLRDLVYEANVDPDEVDARIAKYNFPRQPKSSEQLTPEQMVAVQPYTYEGKKTVALNVRPYKDDNEEE
jgi:hypothetical protein